MCVIHWIGGLREPKTGQAHSYLPNTMLRESPATTDEHVHSQRAILECINGYSYARALRCVVQGKEYLQHILYIRLCVHLSPNTVSTHIHGHVLRRGMCVFLWQQSEIWRGTAVLGCINYKKVMNQRQGKSVSLQESVCSLGTVPPLLLHDKHVIVYARAGIFLMFVHKCLCKLQVPSICAMRH